MEKLYENIKKFRMERNMGQGELAQLVGYASNSMIAQVESGIIDINISKLRKFAEALQVPVPVLLGYEDPNSFYAKLDGLPNEAKKSVEDYIEYMVDRHNKIQ